MQIHPDDNALNEYLDGALEPSARAVVERHLAACPRCTARADELRAVFAALAALPEESLSRDLAPSVVAGLPRAAPQPLPLSLRWVSATQLVAAGALLVLAWPLVLSNLPLLPDATVALIAAAGTETLARVNLLVSGLVADWQTLAGQLQAWTQPVADAWRGLAIASLPWADWALCLAAAALLWAAGNGLLLRPAATRDYSKE